MLYSNAGMVKMTLYGLNSNPFASNYPTAESVAATSGVESAEIPVYGMFAKMLIDFVSTVFLDDSKIVRKNIHATWSPQSVKGNFPSNKDIPFEEYYYTELIKCTHHWLYVPDYNIQLTDQDDTNCVKVNIMGVEITENDDGTKNIAFELESAGKI